MLKCPADFTWVHRVRFVKVRTLAPVEITGSEFALVGFLGLEWFQWKPRGLLLARSVSGFTPVHRASRTPALPVEKHSPMILTVVCFVLSNLWM